MLATKLFASPIRQSIGTTTCRALAHTDIQFPDYSAFRRPSTAGLKKKNIETEDQRKVLTYLMTTTVGAASPKTAKPVVTKSAASLSASKDNLTLAKAEVILATQYFDHFHSYCQMVDEAKSLARRSILIDHCGLKHIEAEFDNIEKIYTIEKETKRGITKLSLIEFKSENDAEIVAKQARHNEGLLPVTLKIFRYNGPASFSPNQQNLPVVRLTYKREQSSKFDNYTEFISNNMMSLIDLKMRFITLVNFERILCAGMFAEYELMPFGSSVIDLGCDSCDLDLVVTRRENHHELINDFLTNPKKLYNPEPISKLAHLDKSLYSEQRDPNGVKNTMRWFDYILREYMPLTDGYGVLFLRYAKVPIIKFTSRITSLDCDLSFNFGLDHREQDVLTTNYSAIYLRIFAKLVSITSKGPNVGLTNFQFLSLILFYLQRTSITSKSSIPNTDPTSRPKLRIENYQSKNQRPIVPSFKELLTGGLRYREEPGRAVKELDDEQLNQLIPELIIGFFEFYSKFDFSTYSMNLFESRSERKLDNSSIYVLNPLDRSRNICHNVTRKGLEQFVVGVKAAFECCKKDETPLSLIKSLMIAYQKESKKHPDDDHNDLRATTESIVHDIFR